MTTTCFREQATILVAVQLNDQGTELVRSAAVLAKQAKMRLEILHTIEPIFPAYGAGFDLIAGLSPLVLQDAEDAEFKRAGTVLRQLADTVDAAIPCQTTVARGFAAETILAAATTSKASLIVTGAAQGSHRFVPRGLSTALALMSNAPTPVLVLPSGVKFAPQNERLQLLLADDLRDQTQNTVETAYALAGLFPASTMLHIHVSRLTKPSFLQAMANALNVARASETLKPEDLWALAERSIADRLEQRGAEAAMALRCSGGKVNRATLSGQLFDVLTEQIASFKPDLLAVGRHQRFHGPGLALGALPFYVMLSLQKPLLIVPGTDGG